MMRPPSGRLPCRKAWNKAGISFRHARSPVPPKRTRSKLMDTSLWVVKREHAACRANGTCTDPLAADPALSCTRPLGAFSIFKRGPDEEETRERGHCDRLGRCVGRCVCPDRQCHLFGTG